jgi:hypothetical protein
MNQLECGRCKENKDNSEFYINNKLVRKFSTLCKACVSLENKERREETKNQRPPVRKRLFFDPINNIKECGTCHIQKSGTEFGHRNNTTSKLDTDCKSCVAEYKRNYRAKNKLAKETLIKGNSNE